jgi:hypothetical protein
MATLCGIYECVPFSCTSCFQGTERFPAHWHRSSSKLKACCPHKGCWTCRITSEISKFSAVFLAMPSIGSLVCVSKCQSWVQHPTGGSIQRQQPEDVRGGGRTLGRLKAFRCKHAEMHEPRIESKAQLSEYAGELIIYGLVFASQSLLGYEAGSQRKRPWSEYSRQWKKNLFT